MLKRIFKDKGYRKRAIELFSLIFSCTFGIFNGILSFLSSSVWFLMLSVYYVALAAARLRIYKYRAENDKKDVIGAIKLYRNSGIFLLLMNFAICVAVLQIVFIEKGFKYTGVFIYAVAAYAFTKIILAIINIAKTRGTENYTEMALRTVNLIDASVSILALQTALLNEFSEPTADFRLANGLTGAFVVLFTLAFGIFMIVKAHREIKTERDNGK